MEKKTIWALIPTKSHSSRISNKNVRLLAGHSLYLWSVDVALRSGIYDKVIVVTESCTIADEAMVHGADVFRRSMINTADDSPDISWIYELFTRMKQDIQIPEVFSILRPTSPFRTVEMLKRGHLLFESNECDSVRAVEPLNLNLYKVWKKVDNKFIEPFFDGEIEKDGFIVPFHSYPSQFAPNPRLYKQNASLEISYTKNVLEKKSISGDKILPFETEGYEGFDINTMDDWYLAEALIRNGRIKMKKIEFTRGGVLLNTY